MKKFNLLNLDAVNKQELVAVTGGASIQSEKCPCICFGPLIKEEEEDGSSEEVNYECAQCVASDAAGRLGK
ncbi:MAG: hypothetical protein K2H46_11775 [Muribaculaceae bacterium]|nr:hypothetical protein [Muribaculaceae bacterium]